MSRPLLKVAYIPLWMSEYLTSNNYRLEDVVKPDVMKTVRSTLSAHDVEFYGVVNGNLGAMFNGVLGQPKIVEDTSTDWYEADGDFRLENKHSFMNCFHLTEEEISTILNETVRRLQWSGKMPDNIELIHSINEDAPYGCLLFVERSTPCAVKEDTLFESIFTVSYEYFKKHPRFLAKIWS